MLLNPTLLEITTPKGIVLHGMWFGPENPRRVLIMLHGLGSSMFSNHEYLLPLVNNTTAVLYFNNRGHDLIARIKKRDRRKKRGYTSFLGGATHEIFTDCIDDIEGAVKIGLEKGAQDIYLVGHSTGCQKIAYYLSMKTKGKYIKGAVFISPMSDYAAGLKFDIDGQLKNNIRKARELISQRKPHALLPDTEYDAQRFVSLYTPDSKEEIFCYAHMGKKPTRFQRIKTPLLVLLAQKDEYRDRNIKKIAHWFERYAKAPTTISIVENATHNFYEKEGILCEQIKKFIS